MNRLKDMMVYAVALWIAMILIPLIVMSVLLPMYPIAVWMMTKHIIARYKEFRRNRYENLI